METRIVRVPNKGSSLGAFQPGEGLARLDHWEVQSEPKESLMVLRDAAQELKTKDTPVAFPTETVYGLGADATRSGAVKGIYSAKGRPSDNPLIIHVCDLDMLRHYLDASNQANGAQDPIPSRYKTLIERFWPGPLTILMPNPEPSRLAPEVTAGLKTFGVRMPSSPLALSLISLAGVPLAAPSANASTKPSPTAAQHVMDDLNGRIELILDGGHCDVGVESTVVDGLCDPPVVLRPGGIGLDELRSCPGWENVAIAYKDKSEEGKAAPRAPGMKYKHYSPKAKVVLYESSYEDGSSGIVQSDIAHSNGTAVGTLTNGHKTTRKIGVIRTQRWQPGAGLQCTKLKPSANDSQGDREEREDLPYQVYTGELLDEAGQVVGQVLDIDLGRETEGIARGLFSALREFDRRGADTIFVDGIEDRIDIAAAVMNRLRKAASEIRA
ncbi:telomere recombination-domain-containing protein [Mariannaea sp. PMI_226]|nr:telomere recombination-domain-containing protein [Mariannaea sp. PMI_226]